MLPLSPPSSPPFSPSLPWLPSPSLSPLISTPFPIPPNSQLRVDWSGKRGRVCGSLLFGAIWFRAGGVRVKELVRRWTKGMGAGRRGANGKVCGKRLEGIGCKKSGLGLAETNQKEPEEMELLPE
ncbi:hypothetical protein K435DRAFT_872577 [Dendrothele bispora CBS 962.96]|uniref:Uncharacterized protein n=1 Tax=Dendrothele bispora (strain CBS 962.96) TaxID=1314807 RepID=A0A4S8L1A0_DENBC|nr:hypothetical protein K435DRAFT_872577 [Dendrothele bispora CBS 962.96]